MKKIAVINGPNLNFLGIRDQSIYGQMEYSSLVKYILDYTNRLGLQAEVFQSNSEGGIIDYLQKCYFDQVEGIVINPGAYTHYSYAILDAISSTHIPTVEVHISNIYEREEFRKTSVTKDACMKQIYGKGINGYIEAIDFLIKRSNL